MTAYCKVRIKFLVVLFSGISLLFLEACKKPEETVSADFIGLRNPFDIVPDTSLQLVAYTTTRDSFITRNLSLYMLGNINDPKLGSSTANIISQVSLPVNQFTFGPSFTGIDSMVLQITYGSPTAFYGKLNTPQLIRVYEMNEVLSNHADSLYFSNRNYNYSTTALGEYSGTFENIDDSVYITQNGVTLQLVPHMRIRITNSAFIQKFEQGEANGMFIDNSAFQQQMKGFAIVAQATPTAGNGGIAYMNMFRPTTALVIYYNGTQRAEFPLTVNSVRANQYIHNHLPSLNLQPYFSTQHFNENYVQSMCGLKTRIMIPGLFDLVKNRKIAITGAQIVFQAKDDVDPFTLPKELRLFASDSLGRLDFINDFFEGGAYYGGTLDPATKTYRFNINRHIQFLLNEYLNHNKNYNYGLNLVAPADNPLSAARAVFDTGPGKLKLNLTYSVIK
jgi:hypothetical protein